MNEYSKISHEVGLKGSAVIPSKEDAIKLAKRARAFDREAFTELLRVCRFAGGAEGREQEQALSIIVHAWKDTADHWRGIDDEKQ